MSQYDDRKSRLVIQHACARQDLTQKTADFLGFVFTILIYDLR